jgi:hypothetical protein
MIPDMCEQMFFTGELKEDFKNQSLTQTPSAPRRSS